MNRLCKVSLLFFVLMISQRSIAQSSEFQIAGTWLAKDFDNATIEITKDSKGYWIGKILNCPQQVMARFCFIVMKTN
jgi:hypothetical protein